MSLRFRPRRCNAAARSYLWWTRDNGTFSAYGLYGQQTYIDPARRLVVAINSAWSVPEFTNESRAARAALFDAIRAAIDSEPRSNSGK